MAFDPDAYLQKKAPTPQGIQGAQGFDPDAYLVSKSQPVQKVPAKYREMYALDQEMNQEGAQAPSLSSIPQPEPPEQDSFAALPLGIAGGKYDAILTKEKERIAEANQPKPYKSIYRNDPPQEEPLESVAARDRAVLEANPDRGFLDNIELNLIKLNQGLRGTNKTIDPITQGIQRAGTYGLADRASPYLTAGVDKALQGVGIKSGDQSYSNLVSQDQAEIQSELERQKQESPISSMIGEGIGTAVGFQPLYKGAEAIVGAPAAIEKGAPLVQKALNALQNTGKLAGAGAVSNLAYDKLRGAEISPEESLGIGGASNVIIPAALKGLGKGLSAIPKAASKISEAVAEPGPIVQRLKGLATGWENPAAGWQKGAKEARLSKYGNKLEKLAEGKGASDEIATGKALGEQVSSAKKALSDKFEETVNPILEAHGEKPANVEKIIGEIGSIFKKNNLLDVSGNLKRNVLEKLPSGDPTRKMFETLAEYSTNLQTNPTLGELSLIKKSLQNLAKFDKVSGSPLADVSKRIAGVAREALEENIGQYAGAAGKEQFTQGMKEYATKAPIYKTLKKITSKAPEKIPNAVRNLEGSVISDMVTKAPEIKESVAKVVLSQISQKATNPKQLTKLLNKYGRENLGKILDDESVKALEKLERLNLSPLQRIGTGFFDAIASPKSAKAVNYLAGMLEKTGKLSAPIGEKVYKSIYRDGR
jgi:hypothetical protein